MRKKGFIAILFLLILQNFLISRDFSSTEPFKLIDVVIQNRNEGNFSATNLGNFFPNGLGINGYTKEWFFAFFYGDNKYFTPYPSFQIELGKDSNTLFGNIGISLIYTHRFVGNDYSYFLPFEGFSGEKDEIYRFLMSEIYFADFSLRVRKRIEVRSSLRFGLLDEMTQLTFLGIYERAPIQISYKIGNLFPGFGFDFITDITNIRKAYDLLPEVTNVRFFICYQFIY